jgi:hypothetical protein
MDVLVGDAALLIGPWQQSCTGIVRETSASGFRGPASPDLSIIDVTRLSR